MKTTFQYVHEIQQRYGLRTEQEVAAYLDVDQGAISRYRTQQKAFSEVVALRVAKLLNADPLEVLASSRAGAARSPEVADAWERIYWRAQLGQLPAVPQASPSLPRLDALMARSHLLA